MSDKYVDFFLNSASSVVQYETFELSHPNFTKVYRVVRNNTLGISAYLETGILVDFDYYPARITPNTTEENLDYSVSIEFGDLGEILPTEIDRVITLNGFGTKPTLIYRTFRSDDLSGPMLGPIKLEIVDLTFNKTGVSFEARAPVFNSYKTGQTYTLERFPMLEGFLT